MIHRLVRGSLSAFGLTLLLTLLVPQQAAAQFTCPAGTNTRANAATIEVRWDDGAPQCRTGPIFGAQNQMAVKISGGTAQPSFTIRVSSEGNGGASLTSVACTDEILPRGPAAGPNDASLLFLQADVPVSCVITATDFNGRPYTASFTVTDVSVAGGDVTVSHGVVSFAGVGNVFDQTPPGVILTTSTPNVEGTTPFTATVTFTEDVTGFVLGDLTATNATLSNFVAVSASVYTATVTPTGAGDVGLSVAAGVAQDLNANPNAASGNAQVTVSNPAGLVQDALQGRAMALLAAQPDLRGRSSEGGPRFNVQATRGVGSFDLDTGGGPVWLAVQGHWSETGTSRLSFGMATLGLQHETAGGAVGALVQIDLGTHTGPVGAEVAGRGLAVGPYVVQELGNGLSFDGRLLVGRTLNDVTLGAGNTARNVDGARVLATAQLTGTTPLGASGVVLSPRASVGYVRESLEGFTAGGMAVAAHAFTLGEAVVGGDLRLPATGTLTLTMGLAAHWAYQQSSGGGVPSTTLPDTARGRIDLGAEFAARNGLSARAGVYRDGLGTTGYRAQGAAVRVDWQF